MTVGEESRLIDRWQRAVRSTRARQRPTLLSLSLSVPPVEDPLQVAAAAVHAEAHTFYWQRPSDDLALVGIGQAHVLQADGPDRFRKLSSAVSALFSEATIEDGGVGGPLHGPALVGGFAFTAGGERDPRWAEFPDARLILPRVLLRQRGKEATLTLCSVAGDGDDPARSAFATLRACASAACDGASTPSTYEIHADRSAAEWSRSVESCLERIRGGRLDKVVLARSCTVRSDSPLDPVRLTSRLRRSFPECTAFWIRSGAASFVGATPEPLLRAAAGVVHSAAIAGSAPRGSTPAHDEALARALLASGKERREHAIVVDAIRAALLDTCVDVHVPFEPELLRLENVQHLITRIDARRRADVGLLDLAERLHPSPAVAGFPRLDALSLIAAHEGMDRGWYAGPIGWLDARGDGELAVALRAALVRGREARLFAGAGIVADSDPEAELNETRLKMQPVLSGLLEF